MDRILHRFAQDRHRDLLEDHVINCLPDAVCNLPVIKSDGLELKQSLSIPMMNSIRLAWSTARKYGYCSIQWLPEGLDIKVGRKDGYVFYGMPDFYHGVGYPTINNKVLEAICSYRLVRDYLQKRIKNGYNRLIALSGEVSDDMSQDTYEAIGKKFIDNDQLLFAPEGSKLDGSSVPLTEIQNACDPFIKAIAYEAGLPFWLFDSHLSTSQFSSTDKSKYLTDQFYRQVAPCLVYLFASKGFEIEVIPPDFRDSLYKADVDNTIQDTSYKKAATGNLDANKSMTLLNVKQLKEGKDEPPTPVMKPKKPNTGRKL